MVNAATEVGSRLAMAVEFARREPAKVLFAILALHLVVWTLLPALICPNLQLDLAEDLALGKEWQLGYWKHPPLPWWAADLVYRAAGDVHAVYLLGPLAAVVCLYAVWLIGREIVGDAQALIAVAALEGLHFFNFSVPKFAHDQMQLPFWALTALFFYRGLARKRALDWLLAGAFLALAFWSKYAAFALAATLGLFLLMDGQARPAWRTPGPWLMALAFAVVIAPNLWWLADTGFMPFHYVDARAKIATHWYQYLWFPLQWTASQLFFLLPTIGLLALLLMPPLRAQSREPRPEPEQSPAFGRRYLLALALGPFVVTTLVAAVLGRLPVAMWGYPLWSSAPLAILAWLGPVTDARRLSRFAVAFIAVFAAAPIAYAAVEIVEPLIRDRPKATQFPGRLAAERITAAWHARFGTPLVYAGGTEFAVNNLAVYSPDRPHVVVHGDPALSAWIDMRDLRRRGAVLVWEEGLERPYFEAWRATFGDFELQPTLVLPRQTRASVNPARIVYAFVPPRL